MIKPEISVCIPAYEMDGHGAGYLEILLQKLEEQDFRDFEVVVSDQSTDNRIEDMCNDWSDRLNIYHVWNREAPRQASANINHALDCAEGGILKVLFQDDYLCDRSCLAHVHQRFMETGCDWLLCGSGVVRDGDTIERAMVPSLNEKLHFGKNTVSSPSVLAIHRRCVERFDENLIWLMDVEFYKRLWEAKGEPEILPTTLVANRIHAYQVSNRVDRRLQARELDYVWRKYAAKSTTSGKLEYLKRRMKTIFST
ncbi:glycosyltransferase family 2 protein [Roseovarius sp. C7]|uniref:glycosyltransferase family 2 protein n=1 Tax=Roseovarius sp. C7 TaxID=3398643 RepID=UPI0039F72232